MPDAVSGGNGLFLMAEQFVTNIGRAHRRVVPILGLWCKLWIT